MLFRKELRSLARHVAKDLRSGRSTARSRRAMDFMAENPSAIVGAIDLARQQAHGERADDSLIGAYCHLIGFGLEVLRFRIEGGDELAGALVDGVREMLLNLAESGEVGPDLLVMLLGAFTQARLPPGDDLMDLMGGLAAEAGQDGSTTAPEDIDAILESIAEESGGDEFAAHAGLMEVGGALPPDFRKVMVNTLAKSAKPVLQDCAALFLFDAAPEVRRTVCEVIGGSGSSPAVSPRTLRRLIAVRNWLPARERPGLDTAIKEARRACVECASWPPTDVSELLATAEDGVGAQSVFAVGRDGRKQRFSALLVKRGVGIVEAWSLRGQTKADIKRVLGRIRAETDSIPVSMEFVRRLTSHHLADGLKRRQVPPAGLVEFVEAIGLETCQPQKLDAEALIELLGPEIARIRLSPDAVGEVLQSSAHWLQEISFMESWFEADAEVDEALSKRAAASRSARVKAVTRLVLEPRRHKWAERLLWTALWAKEQSDLLSEWISPFIVGRELHRGRRLAEIPVMRTIAERTVEAWEEW